jgi:hypothetical protein
MSTVAIFNLGGLMLTDRENRPALALTLAAHAVMMGLMALGACFVPLGDSYVGMLIVLPVILLYFFIVLAGIAWIAESPVIRKLNDSSSYFLQGIGCSLFLAGLIAIVTLAIMSFVSLHVWSYAGFALLSGIGAIRQYRLCALDERVVIVPAFPVARLMSR